MSYPYPLLLGLTCCYAATLLHWASCGKLKGDQSMTHQWHICEECAGMYECFDPDCTAPQRNGLCDDCEEARRQAKLREPSYQFDAPGLSGIRNFTFPKR